MATLQCLLFSLSNKLKFIKKVFKAIENKNLNKTNIYLNFSKVSTTHLLNVYSSEKNIYNKYFLLRFS